MAAQRSLKGPAATPVLGLPTDQVDWGDWGACRPGLLGGQGQEGHFRVVSGDPGVSGSGALPGLM